MADPDDKPLSFTDKLAAIPCFRESYLYGICGGLGSGLLFFMGTSQPRRATNFAFGTFVVTTLGYWVYCRHHWETQKQEALLLNKLMREYIAKEGTAEDLNKQVPEIVTVANTKL